MATENAKFRVRNRTVEIKWVSLFCDHVMDNFIHKNKDHDLRFTQIAALLRTCEDFEPVSGRVWCDYNELNGRGYKIIFILSTKFAVVKTCYRYGRKDNI
jgi:hypothetical protein